MWGSKRNDRAPFDDLMDDRDRPEPKVEAPVVPPPQPRADTAPVEAPTPRREEPVVARSSVLGRTLQFHGELWADEDLVLQGRVEGSITHSGSLTIGEAGATIGNIAARQIIVEGTVEGDLTAEASVSVRASGIVHGSIVAPRVALADGARFKGSIDMDATESAGRATPPTAARTERKVEEPVGRQAGGTAG